MSLLLARGKRRSAFTLVELLVVIAIIGVLIALLLPAVQAAREAARRSQCTNQLKQLGLGMHNHHDVKKAFPSGKVDPHMSNWAIEILPYIEEQALYDNYDFGQNNNHGNNSDVTQAIMVGMQCPSDANATGGLRRPSADHSNRDWAPGSYRAVGGRGKVGANGESYWDSTGMQIGTAADQLQSVDRGALHLTNKHGLRPESFASVLDGSSKTLMVGEYHTKTEPGRSVFWAKSYYGYNMGTIVPTAGSGQFEPDFTRCQTLTSDVGTCRRAFASFHSGGVINFLMVDGSVRGLNRTIDVNLAGNLATIAGSEVTADF